MTGFVREGPREILAGHYLPNDHELFGVLAWATTSLAGESEIAARAWSVLPFIVGVAVVAAWLHRRMGAASGALFLFLATVAPLLLDLSRQARGYGLAFLAMSVLVVAALEAIRSARTRAIVAYAAAGVVGTWTLPNFGVAFLATGAVLLLDHRLRLRIAVATAVSGLAVLVFYAPNLAEVLESSRADYGRRIETAELVVAPLLRILLPGLLSLEGTEPAATLAWAPILAAVALVMGSSPLLRQKQEALVLCAGVVASVVAVWATGTFVVPRFFSFLLVPLLVLVATGLAVILGSLLPRPPLLRTLAAVAVLALVSAGFAAQGSKVLRLPREAHEQAAAAVRASSPDVPVLAQTLRPADLEFYLGRPVTTIQVPGELSTPCHSARPFVVVVQHLGPPVQPIDCLLRAGVRHHRFEQYSQGDRIEVWLVPGVG